MPLKDSVNEDGTNNSLSAARPVLMRGLRRPSLDVLLVLWAGVLLGPSTVTRFDGLPLSSAIEAFALAMFAPILVSASLRRALRGGLRRTGEWASVTVFVALVATLVFKIVLLPSKPPGFVACYQSVLSAPPAGRCERSFENPFFRFDATRVDSSIDFGPEDWDLSFFNSLRFNFWEVGQPRRDRLPFTARWVGTTVSPGQNVVITYVGEGSVALGDRVIPLPPSYDSERTVAASVSPGRLRFRALYTFDDGSRIRVIDPRGPGARLRIKAVLPGVPATAPLRAADPQTWLRAVAVAIDVMATAPSVLLLFWYLWLARSERRVLLMVAIVCTAVPLTVPVFRMPVDAAGTLIVLALLVSLLARNRSSKLILAYLTLLIVGVWMTADLYPRIGTVTYRASGHDYLTFESLARTILETQSLEGGEQVFYNQPLFRYVRFVERVVFGDGDPLIHLLGWLTLHWSILWSASVLAGTHRMRGFRRMLFTISAALTLTLAGTSAVTSMIGLSLSEHTTWIFTAAAFGFLAGRGRALRWSVGAALLGAAMITRPNQAPGLVAVAIALLGAAARQRPRSVLLAALAFVTVCSLPVVHNLYYGGRAVLFTTTAAHPATAGVSIATLLKFPADASARAATLTQVGGLLFHPPHFPADPIGGYGVRYVGYGLQAVWLPGLLVASMRRVPWHVRLLAFAPALYLAVHIIYDITSYYPRHILAAYFVMGLGTMAIAGQRTLFRNPSS